MKNKIILSFLLCVAIFMSQCSLTTHSVKVNGTHTPDGTPRSYQTTTNIGLHVILGSYPVYKSAEFDATLDAFTKAARKNGSSKIRIIQTETTRWVLLLPPFTLIFTPVHTQIVGEIY